LLLKPNDPEQMVRRRTVFRQFNNPGTNALAASDISLAVQSNGVIAKSVELHKGCIKEYNSLADFQPENH
jgi:hypothetical protein